MNIKIHTSEEFESMRKAGRLAAETLDYITPFIKPKVTTHELDILCHDFIVSNGAIPAPLNYNGFPRSICTSINRVVCHGIPGDRRLTEGDILNVDITVILDGWHGDSSRMYYAGSKIPVKARLLTEATYTAMMKGIKAIKPGSKINVIGKEIQSYIDKKKFSVVEDFCGHGIGRVFHDTPNILHFENDQETEIVEGMFFTVEPMINAGKSDVIILEDGWTAVTKDRSLSAQFEHTIGVTKEGCEIFTLSPKGWHCPPYL